MRYLIIYNGYRHFEKGAIFHFIIFQLLDNSYVICIKLLHSEKGSIKLFLKYSISWSTCTRSFHPRNFIKQS